MTDIGSISQEEVMALLSSPQPVPGSKRETLVYPQIGAIVTTEKNKQVLDKLQVERERGITVKAQTASLFYTHQGHRYLLNLIDTPVRPPPTRLNLFVGRTGWSWRRTN